MIKVNAYTGGVNVPGSRYRVRQLISELTLHGVDVNEIISQAGIYPPIELYKRPLWGVSNLLENAFKCINQPDADVSFIQREMFTMHKTFETFLKGPRVLDVDDAIFLYRGGDFIRKISIGMQKVICGNNYLANHFSKWNSSVDVIPTAVNVKSYDLAIGQKNKRKCVIVWSGSSSGFKFLYSIESALKVVLERYPEAVLRIVSNVEPNFTKLKLTQFEFVKWTPEIEFSSIKNCDIGIMPIHDDDWSRGKCSFKMLCYMASQIPVVVSPHGMNKEVLALGDIGYGPKSDDDWIDALGSLIMNEDLRTSFGARGHQIVKSNFDIPVIASKVAKALKSVV